MALENIRRIIEGFLAAANKEPFLAEDAEFITMFDGIVCRGPAEINAMLQDLYQVTFQARVERKNLILSESHAILEADFVGRHTGEYQNVSATGKQVSVPFCVVYDVTDERIQQARIYFELPVLMQQLRSS